MPLKNGRDILKEVKQNTALKSIPIIILTTSNSENDIKYSYKLGANCFIAKSIDLKIFWETINSIEDFWFKTAKLPN